METGIFEFDSIVVAVSSIIGTILAIFGYNKHQKSKSTQTKVLEERIDAVVDRLDKHEDYCKDREKRTDKAFKQLTKAVRRLEKKMDKGFAQGEKRFDNLDHRLTKVEAVIAGSVWRGIGEMEDKETPDHF